MVSGKASDRIPAMVQRGGYVEEIDTAFAGKTWKTYYTPSKHCSRRVAGGLARDRVATDTGKGHPGDSESHKNTTLWRHTEDG